MEKSFTELLDNAKLTKTGTIIAEYILENMMISCFLTSTELAAKLNVSEASVIRFSRSIGFKGYIDFQKYLQRIHLDTVTKISDQVEFASERMTATMQEHPGELHFSIEAMKIADQSLRNLYRYNGVEKYKEIVDLIVNSNLVYIASSRPHYNFENRLYMLLSQIRSGVITTGGSNSTLLERMVNISDQDVFIILDLPPYTKLNFAAMDMAHDSGAKIIVITTLHNDNVPNFVDYKLFVDLGSNSYFPSMVSMTFLIEMIANGVSRALKEKAIIRLEKADFYMNKYNLTKD